MSKIQECSLPMLALVIAHDLSLDRTAPLQSVPQRLCIQGEQLIGMLKTPVSKFTVQNQTMLHHFS
ncbi:hypothetical protein D3C75_937110 [compost metagenome]